MGLGNDAKWEYFQVIYERYHKAERKARAALLDEFLRNHRLQSQVRDSTAEWAPS